MDTLGKHAHNINLGIALLAGSLIVLGTLIGEFIPVMSIWYLNNSGVNYQAYITLLGYSISQEDIMLVDSEVHLLSQIFIIGMVLGGVLILAGIIRGFHMGIFAGTLVTFLSMFTMAVILPSLIENLTGIPGGLDRFMYDGTLSPSFTFGYVTPTGYLTQFLGGGYWLVGAGVVLGFLAWYRLSTTMSPEDIEVARLEKQVEHSVRHIQMKRAGQIGQTPQVKNEEGVNTPDLPS